MAQPDVGKKIYFLPHPKKLFMSCNSRNMVFDKKSQIETDGEKEKKKKRRRKKHGERTRLHTDIATYRLAWRKDGLSENTLGF